MTKRLFLIISISWIISSCGFFTKSKLDDIKFPLEESQSKRFENSIDYMAVGETWVAVFTNKEVVALNAKTLDILWSMNTPSYELLADSRMVNNQLVALSANQILLIDEKGGLVKIDIDTEAQPVIKVLGISSNYVYIVGGNWTVIAYNILEKKLLWKKSFDRGVGSAYYDKANDLVYIISDDVIRTYQNSSGELFWQRNGDYGPGVFYELGILYFGEKSNKQNKFNLVSLNGLTQEILWEKEIEDSPDFIGSAQAILGDFIVYGRHGLIAINKSNGEIGWSTKRTGEEFYETPIEFNNIIYTKGSDNTVYAISAIDGAIVGKIPLEDSDWKTVVKASLFVLDDGIIFYTKKEIFLYKAKD